MKKQRTKRAAMLVALCVFVVMLFALHGQDLVASQPVGNAADVVAQERVPTLPEDGQLWATILFTSDNWQNNPVERDFVSWFATNARLKALVRQTKAYHYTYSNWEYAQFRHAVQDQFPCLIVQRWDGHKDFKTSGATMPKTSNALADALAVKLAAVAKETNISRPAGKFPHILRPNRPVCPGPGPCPAPGPGPATPPAPSTPPATPPGPPSIPDDTVNPRDDAPEVTEKEGASSLSLVALVGAIGVIGTLLVTLRKSIP